MVFVLTGGSGAFGACVLDALCARDEVAEVHAIVHRTPVPVRSPKVRTVQGDATCENLGLGAEEARTLRSRATGIVHAAAETRFTAPADKLQRANVDAARHVLDFAATCRALDRVCLLSTAYVAGARTGVIAEDELDHDAGFVNAYERSKYDAERLARVRASSLPIAVVRLSTVIGLPAASPRPAGAIQQAIRLMYRGLVPMVPGRADDPVDLVPEAYAAPAVAWLATRGFERGRTYHVAAGSDTIGAAGLLDLTMETFARCQPAWSLRGIPRPPLVDLQTFELFRRSVEEAGDWALREAMAAIGAFAPQLAYPKIFDDERCRRALDGSGIVRPAARPVYAEMVERLIGAPA
jgi:nucleoside-diphosphate-sugar epimerase